MARLYYLLFISHFLFLFVGSFVDLKVGATTLTVDVVITMAVIVASFANKVSWKESRNAMLVLFGIWGVFCFIQLGHPNAIQQAWNAAIPNYLIYPLICAIIVPLCLRSLKAVHGLLIVWSLLVLLAVFKGYWQLSQGFNARELEFLYERGGATTHIIWSGIRYFSFFTDAANFGVHAAMAALGFGLYAFYIKHKGWKVYFFMMSIIALYGMMISGTRSAIAVLVGGAMFLLVISRNWRTFFIGLIGLTALFLFFRYTNIGSSNVYIWKMRSAFNPTTDASYLVRVQNREQMKVHMEGRPLGFGIGLGGKAERYSPRELMPIPPDSWLINVWTDNGVVGVTLYVLIHVLLFAWCSWILMFKLKSKQLRNRFAIWLCMNAGFFIASYTNDVMQYPNVILVYSGFAICFVAPLIEKEEYSHG